MPIYEYRCGRCGEEFEKLVLSGSETVICPECSGAEVSRLMSACAFSVGGSLKGSAQSGCASCSPSPTACSACSTKH